MSLIAASAYHNIFYLAALVQGRIAGFSWPFDDHMHYPLEVLNRAADIFRMSGHMLGQRLLLRLGLVLASGTIKIAP